MGDIIWQVQVFEEGTKGETSKLYEQLDLQPMMMDITDQPMQQDSVENLINIPINRHGNGRTLRERISNSRIEREGAQKKERGGGRKAWRRAKGKM